VIAYKFLAQGAVSPFTGFRWPVPGEWVNAPAGGEDTWVHACRPGDLPYWLEDELWRIELDEPVREARYQVASPRARLVSRIDGWDAALGREYARACALRTRDLALPHLAPAMRGALQGLDDLQAISDAVRRSRPRPLAAAFASDAAHNALHVGPAPTSYIACMLVSTLGDGLAAFEAERAWQARWLATRLGLG
jgi:hypothetical protein